MQIFNLPTHDHASDFTRDGFILINNCVTPEFVDWARTAAQKYTSEDDISRSKRKLKHEYLFEFPDDDAVVQLVTTVAEVTGLPLDRLIVSERHLKVYRADAPQNPPPHKDRRGTQLSVGIALEVPPLSRLQLYPHHERAENIFDSYDEFLASLPEAERPENALRGVEPLLLDTRPGDLVVFWGSSIWHERTNAAGAKMLFLKMNALGLDPLGENYSFLPLTAARRAEEPVAN